MDPHAPAAAYPAQAGTPIEPSPDEPCAGPDSDCGHACYLEDGTWAYETTISIGGIENDVQMYCQCEHHEGDEGEGPSALAGIVAKRLDEARLRQG